MIDQDDADPHLPELIAARAQESPAALAVASSERALTYVEMNSRAERLAVDLRALGVGTDVVVGLCLERSPAYTIGALGIFHAHGAYLAIDPMQPRERIAYMLADAHASIVVASPQTAPQLSGLVPHLVILDLAAPYVPSATVPAGLVTSPHQLAYVVYTSGSTGRPKGVAITHASLLNLVQWHNQAFDVTAMDRATAVASPGFDAAAWEIWPYLAAGASVHFPDETTRVSPGLLRDWLVSERITISFAVTPVAEQLLRQEWPDTPQTSLRILLTGGDALTMFPPRGLPFRLVNNYGPTESTVVTTSGTVPSDSAGLRVPTIGRPIANIQVHILDELLLPVADGEVGELCIAGAGLARGYINDTEATSRSFVANPFGPRGQIGNARLYRTGDLARLEPDGQITFLGRLDDQIKMRGHRIEPAEVVAALTSHPSVRKAAVLACVDGSGPTRLVAYVVPRAGDAPTHRDLCEYLRARVPDYMIPSAFVPMVNFPVTANGKMDRASLPPPTPANVLHDDVAKQAASPVESRVAAILAALLGVPDIAPDENFFMLGGHSLLGAQVIVRLREIFGVDVSLRRLFDAPTAAGIAQEVERLIDEEVASLSDAEVRRLLESGRALSPPTHQ